MITGKTVGQIDPGQSVFDPCVILGLHRFRVIQAANRDVDFIG